MCFVFIWEQTATCASYSLNWEVTRPYVVRGASGDEWGELNGGKGTIGLQAAVPKRPHTRPFWAKRIFYLKIEQIRGDGIKIDFTNRMEVWEVWAVKHNCHWGVMF